MIHDWTDKVSKPSCEQKYTCGFRFTWSKDGGQFTCLAVCGRLAVSSRPPLVPGVSSVWHNGVRDGDRPGFVSRYKLVRDLVGQSSRRQKKKSWSWSRSRSRVGDIGARMRAVMQLRSLICNTS
jgi:hypothetical protein